MSRTVLVDRRYRGQHGIGRYASEVVPRLASWDGRLDYVDGHRPTARTTAQLRLRGRASAPDLYYSPGYLAALDRGVPQLLTVHDLIHLDDPAQASLAKRTYYERVLRPAVRRCGAVLTVSECSRRRVAEWSGLPLEQVVNAGNGLGAPFAGTRPAGGPRGYVAHVGNLRPHKNLDTVLRVARALGPRVPVRCVVDDAPAARRRADELGAGSSVSLLSGLDDGELLEFYAGATVLVMPSTIEGFGLPALEAMAGGVPVVHSCEALREVVGDARFTVPDPFDVDGYVDAVHRASAVTEAEREELRRRAGAHTWDAVAARVRGAFEMLRL